MFGGTQEVGDEAVLALLRSASMEVVGRITWSSNATFLVELEAGGASGAVAGSQEAGAGGRGEAGAGGSHEKGRPGRPGALGTAPGRAGSQGAGTGGGGSDRALAGDGAAIEGFAIYKPERGERPLWDFPPSLWKREVAAYELSRWLAWDLVPPTVGRREAPLGPGSLQRWIDAQSDQHYFTLLDDPRHRAALETVALFDLLVNNADRKAGHCLVDEDGRVWAIDHGVCFHPDPKLRTVIWDFAGDPIPPALLADLSDLARGEVPAGVEAMLDGDEVEALVRRAKGVRSRRRFPHPVGEFPYPWPLI